MQRRHFLHAVVACLILVYYVWLISLGTWRDWVSTTEYYDKLANAFLQGQVALLDQPKQALLELQDPYSIEQREGIPYLWDSSLYNGKYYLYWGPAPALVILPLKLATHAVVGDQYLTFGFLCGAFLFASLIAARLWIEFPSLPPWTMVPALLALGLTNPLPWLLARPAIYEAAIVAGQFFLLGGIYFAFFKRHGSLLSSRDAFVASTCWAFALASRATLLPALLFLLAVWLFKWRQGSTGESQRGSPASALALALPFAVGLIAMGWYNYARFGNVLEFGHRFQLTGMNLHQVYRHIFSFSNLLPNLYNYSYNPMRWLSVFPYAKAKWGAFFTLPFLRPGNPLYYSEQVSGILRTSPFLLFALIPVLDGLQTLARSIREGNGFNRTLASMLADLRWLSAAQFTVAAILLFFPTLLFIVCTMRYEADVVPILALLSAIGFWLGFERLHSMRFLRHLYTISAISLLLYTVGIGMLLAITGYQARFEHFNPGLFDQLTRWFSF